MATDATRMPALFVGHGSPLNALADNRYTQAWRRMGRSLPRPKAVLAISAHWYVRGIAVTAMELPATIHDFYGFPQPLYDFGYPAPGSPTVAGRVRELLQPADVQLDQSWGLDHGTWSVLAHLFPEADVPVVQLSIDATQTHAFHYEIGKRLAPLREEGILLLGSGNVVHNLRVMRPGDVHPYEWAVRFERTVQDHLRRNDHRPLIDYERLDPDALLAAPTPEHYLPLLYVIGAQLEHEAVAFSVAGIDLGSISMLTVAIGADA